MTGNKLVKAEKYIAFFSAILSLCFFFKKSWNNGIDYLTIAVLFYATHKRGIIILSQQEEIKKSQNK